MQIPGIWNAGPDNYFSKEFTWCMRPIADATTMSNIGPSTTASSATATDATSGQDASNPSGAVIGGAIGGVIAGVLLLIVIVLLLCCLLVCMRRNEKTGMWGSVYYRST